MERGAVALHSGELMKRTRDRMPEDHGTREMTVAARETIAADEPRRVGRGAFRRSAFLLTMLIACLLVARPAGALVELDITSGNIQPMPIAIPNFLGGGADAELGANIASVITNDLEHSGLFLPIAATSFP